MGYTLFALAGGELRAQNLQSILSRRDIPCTTSPEKAGRSTVCVLADSLSAGFEFPTAALAAVSDSSTGRLRRRPREKEKGRNRIHRYTDLTPGDLVVHEHHGIGRFVGMERINVDGVWRDYVKIAYAGTDFVFVPVTNLDLVSKYIGGGEQDNVKLNKLGSPAWNKSKSRAKKAAKEMAETLIKLYAARRSQNGFAFLPDDDMQRSFEEAFPFEETEDQLVCTREIKSDMERSWPMDRLLCGDVGFGKTEVAFRAVMKCILSGKQAAILVPTTVLARQHYLTAKERFSGYPVRVEVMSRFQGPAKHKETLRLLGRGDCDLVVGTHRLLQKDVHFKDLGLLVVDEEQRFGVGHKEQIKQMTNAVDVLTLTATPIPRTLNMALGGIRDMSVLEEAPLGRQPVQTYVLEHNDAILRDAIRRELDRGGQVYYLHNRIETINRVADDLQRRFPETMVRVVHGRMSEEEIGDVMGRTYEGEIGILVCTTIIETGIDIPNVNTLIIE
ncbi:MAG TPA: DEAD/DEAH box helicase, partial [Armatimonadota bacterium]|nr:DEAD/DEAH box helicase [Armatimonadota bacterium]